MTLQMEVATEELLSRLEAKWAELEACPPDTQLVWRLNQKAVLGAYTPVLLFTIRKLQQKAAQQAERLDNQTMMLENLDSAYHTEHTRYVQMKARAVEAEEVAAGYRRELLDEEKENDRIGTELENVKDAYERLNERTTELLDKIDRLSNELHICRHDLGRCD